MKLSTLMVLLGLSRRVALDSPVNNDALATQGTCAQELLQSTEQRHVLAGPGILREGYRWHHMCLQSDPLFPERTDSLAAMEIHLASGDFLEASAKRVSGAVQINTTSMDGMESLTGDNPAWDHMKRFSDFLNATFPLAHQSLDLERVNTHGLVYTWKGANESLEPTVLMAHQDVVPIESETEDSWTHGPFSGHWDGKYVWGRGAIDCKSTLIATLEAVEEFLRANFSPQRTAILSFGFDEEISGNQGARRIAEHLTERYSEYGVAVIVDEGLGIMHSWWGSLAALPGVAEKGYLDVEVGVHMHPGHASLPPDDNSITIMADIIHELNANKYNPTLAENNPIVDTIFCSAQNDRTMPLWAWKEVVAVDQGRRSMDDLVARVVPKLPKLPAIGGLFRTTQSIGMMHAGNKVNVVPGHASLLINHRINHGSTVEGVKNHVENIVRGYTASHAPNGKKITVDAWTDQVVATNQSRITLKALPGALEPSLVSPSHVERSVPYAVLQGTTFAQYGPALAFVAPALMPARTDTRHHERLSENIFRFSPGKDISDDSDKVFGPHGAHSTNERVNMEGHVNAVQWYSLFLRNMDRAQME